MAETERTPTLGRFFVLVLVVTCSFIVVFQQTLPEAVATTLTGSSSAPAPSAP